MKKKKCLLSNNIKRYHNSNYNKNNEKNNFYGCNYSSCGILRKDGTKSALIKLQNGDSIKELFHTKGEAVLYTLNNLHEKLYEIIYIDTDLFGIYETN